MAELSELKPGAQLFWAEALKVPARFGHKEPGLNHFLLALLERHGPMAESLASGLSAPLYSRKIKESLDQGDIGGRLDPNALLAEALAQATGAGRTAASERDLATVLLKKAGFQILLPSSWQAGTPPDRAHGPEIEPDQEAEGSPLQDTPAPSVPSGTFAYRPRARKATPKLEQFGRDLCLLALEGKLPVILGRDLELEAVMQTLCRWTKRNPLLVGPAGVGKTAIIEALAQRIVAGQVPAPLQGLRIFALQASSLVAGASMAGQLEERVREVLNEASQDGLVLFIDEIHTIVGSGGVRQVSDIGSLLKPALAKGDLAVIGATTDAEYAGFMEQDRALERRFQPVRVQELAPDATLEILRNLREKAIRERGVTLTDQALSLMILLAQRYLRNRHFPDKGIDLFEQSLSYALLNGVSEVTPPLVQRVVERMVGMPTELGSGLSRRLETVRQSLLGEAFCPEEPAALVSQRLEIAMRGLDIDPARPNAVLFVVGPAGHLPELAARVLAESLFGSRERVIEFDMSRIKHEGDVNWLIGSAPGYIGHDNPVPFHLELAQQPWSVLLLANIDECHPQAHPLLAQAFHDGFFTESHGRRVYLSDAIVVLTATLAEQSSGRPFGLVPREKNQAGEDGLPLSDPTRILSPELMAEVDFVWSPERPTKERVQSWLKQWVFPELTERYERQGLAIQWDSSMASWLSAQISKAGDLTEGERLVEGKVLPLLLPYLQEPTEVTLLCDPEGTIQIRRAKGEKNGV